MQASAIIDEVSEDGLTPLVVDLDGTLIHSDLLTESAFALVGADPFRIRGFLVSLCKGKATLKAEIANQTTLDAAHLPYDDHVLALVREARGAGRQVHLASTSDERYAKAIFEHLKLFDGWFASNKRQNLTSSAKAQRLVEMFGEQGFDYVGNDRADLVVWRVARRRIALNPSVTLRRDLLKLDPQAILLDPPDRAPRSWMKLLRVRQWAKNTLVLVPLVTAQHFDLASAAKAIGAFCVFSLAASAIYMLNDLVDLDADRKQPGKKLRPLAAGTLPTVTAMTLAPLLLVVALGGALAIAPKLAAVLAAYLFLTTAYTFVFKRKMMIDTIVLASLYTIRVIGGAAAISVPVSEWLLVFSMLIFTSVALIKRYVELAALADNDLPDPHNQNYRKSDLDIVAALAAAAGFNAVTIFALYVSSDTVLHAYRHPQALWFVCPILMYWLGRTLLMAHRRQIDDDPIIFSMRDRNSLVAVGLIGVILLGAM